ncbi:hypothetical protein EYZ11_012135 [Aspergillus tanneri]|uniref:Uncharacterized protein n=1 Tax=Aspergillus tanneri TaxID=1220188 RepID=A0A4S3J125_9EURO|nr:hypothetical protein EYZ11_012135 [Aspergillus tanneri]
MCLAEVQATRAQPEDIPSTYSIHPATLSIG